MVVSAVPIGHAFIPYHPNVPFDAERASQKMVDLLERRVWGGSELQLLRDLVTTLPDIAGMKVGERLWRPLHIGVHYGAPVEVIKILCKAYPNGAIARDAHNQTPLHVACLVHSPPEVVGHLLSTNSVSFQPRASKSPATPPPPPPPPKTGVRSRSGDRVHY